MASTIKVSMADLKVASSHSVSTLNYNLSKKKI